MRYKRVVLKTGGAHLVIERASRRGGLEMRAWNVLGLGLVCVAIVGGCREGRDIETTPLTGQALSFVRPQALLVGEDEPADTLVSARLRALGFDVVVRGGAAVAASDAEGKALIFISESVTSATVNTKLTNVAVPIVVSEPALFDDLGLVDASGPNAGWLTTYGDQQPTAQLDIVDSSHPLAAGLSGRLTVTSPGKMVWAVPAPAAIRVASLADRPTAAGVFAYGRGAQMVGLTAPARRVGLFMGRSLPSTLTSEGWLLVDAAIRWATETAPRALLVVATASSPLTSADEALRSRLAIVLGYDVMVKPAAQLSAADAAGAQVVVVSESSASADIGTKLRDVSVPVLSLEPAIWDDMGLTGTAWQTDFGDATNQTQITIVDPGHPLAAGLTGIVSASGAGKYVWGAPSRGAHVVATLPGQPTRATIFAFDKGEPLLGLDAPARRVGFFVGDPTPAALTADGWKLFDAAVRWSGSDRALAITPKVTCRIDRGGGRFTAVFGYKNESPANVFVATGERNAVLPAPRDRGQPEWLVGGGKAVAFTVDSVDGGPVAWVVGGKTATATATTQPSCSPIDGPEGESVTVGDETFTIRLDPAKIAAGAVRAAGANVGLSGTATVSDFGQLSWSMPIDVPAGRNGMQPALWVVADSGNTRSGPLGVGFSLGGLSEINRCRTNFRQDANISEVAQVRYDVDGPLCMDGIRLVEVSQPPPPPSDLPSGILLGQHPREYRTERDSLIRVFRIDGSHAGVPDRFVVLAKNGRVQSYGPSVRPNEGCSAECLPIRWPLTQVMDRFGNTVTYEYQDLGAGVVYEVLPTRILYTGGNGHEPLRTVVLRWETKDAADRDVAVAGGVAFGFTQRLRAIDLLAPDPVAPAPTRSYAFTYESSPRTARTRLKSIIETAAGDGSRPAVTFGWEDGEDGFEENDTGITDVVALDQYGSPDAESTELLSGIVTADLDGDGFDDVIYNDVPRSNTNQSSIVSTYVFNSGRGPHFFSALNSSARQRQSVEMYERPWAFGTANPVDLDGDGVAELSVSQSGTAVDQYGNTATAAALRVWELTPDRVFAPTTRFAWATTTPQYGRPIDLRFADADGDGRVDAIRSEPDFDGDVYRVYRNGSTTAPLTSRFVGNTQVLRLADPDGAGRASLLVSGSDADLVDVNGDGVADTVTSTGVQLGGGGTLPFPSGVSAATGAYRVGDFDGDGRADLLLLDSSTLLLGRSSGFVTNNVPFVAAGTAASGGRRFSYKNVKLCSVAGCSGQAGGGIWSVCVGIGISNAWENNCNIEEYPNRTFCQKCMGSMTFESCEPSVCGRDPSDPRNPPPSLCNLGCNDTPLRSVDGGIPEGYALSRTLDLDADGLTDFVQVERRRSDASDAANTTYRVITYRKKGKRPDMLTRITSGEGASTRVEYSHMGDRRPPENFGDFVRHPEPFYTPGTGCTYPLRCDNQGQWMVKRLISDAGQEDLSGTPLPSVILDEFSYQNARTDVRGRRFLGFAKVISTRSSWTSYPNGTPSVISRREANFGRFDELASEAFPFAGIATQEVRFAYASPNAFATRTVLGDGGAGVTVQHGVPGSTGDNSRIYRVNVTHSTTDEFEAPNFVDPLSVPYFRRTERDQAFDFYGNLQTDTTKVLAAADDLRSTQVVENHYPTGASADASRFLGLPSSTTVTHAFRNAADAASTSVSRTTGYLWDVARAALVDRITEPDGGGALTQTTHLERNADGMVTEEHRLGASGAGTIVDRVTRIRYDALEGMYPERIQNPAGHVTASLFHPALDQAIRVEDANGIVARRAFDRFGRVLQVTGPKRVAMSVDYTRLFGAIVRTTTPAGAAAERVRFDRMGRVVAREVQQFHGDFATEQTLFDVRGRPSVQVTPYETTVTDFDGVGRATAVRTYASSAYVADPLGAPVLRTQTYAHPTIFRDEYAEAVADDLTKSTAVARDVLDQPVAREETLALPGQSGQIVTTTYAYQPFALLGRVEVDGQVTSMTYDVRGRRRTITTPDTGTTTTSYDAFDSPAVEADAAQRVTRWITDDLARVTTQVDQFDGILTTQQVTSFEYDSAPFGIGQLATARSPDGVLDVFAYESTFGQLATRHTYVQGEGPFDVSTTYDEFARLQKVLYPETPGRPRFAIERDFGDYDGIARRLRRADTEAAFWQVTEKDRVGQPARELFGNGALRTSNYDPSRGWLTGIQTTLSTGELAQDLSYSYRRDGNLVNQRDATLERNEGFAYDSLDRLRRWFETDASGAPVADGWRVDYEIDRTGNLTRRDTRAPGFGDEAVTYSYARTNNAGPHAVTSTSLWSGTLGYDRAGNVTTHPALGSIDYTPFNLPRRISGTNGSPGVDYLYDAMGRRVRKHVGGTGGITTTYIGDLYERRTIGNDVVHVFYVGDVAQVNRSGTSSESVSYLSTDRRGSPDLIMGAAVVRQKRDPFGNGLGAVSASLDPRLRSARLAAPVQSSVTLGFTGQEQEDDLGVVNMHGRIYDSRLGRMLQADPILTDVDAYAYVSNNPVMFRDPTGLEPCLGSCEFDDDYVYGDRGPTAKRRPPGSVQAPDPSQFFQGSEDDRNWQNYVSALQAEAAAGSERGPLGNANPQAGPARLPGPSATNQLWADGPAKVLGNQNFAIKDTSGTWQTLGEIGLAMVVVPGAGPASSASDSVLGRASSWFGRVLGKGAARGKSVLGSYPKYLEKAAEIGAKRFNIPTPIWNKMTEAQRWAANEKFLERLVQRGDEVLLTTPVGKISPGTYLEREVKYLLGKGYQVVDEGSRLVPGL